MSNSWEARDDYDRRVRVSESPGGFYIEVEESADWALARLSFEGAAAMIDWLLESMAKEEQR